MLARFAAGPAALKAEGGPAASLLRLRGMLMQLDRHGASLYPDRSPAEVAGSGGATASVAYISRKLNAKLLRQIADPLALCTRALPSWCSSLAVSCPFLFAFETRRLYLHSTAFGLSRALQRLQQHTQDGVASAPNGSNSERSDFRLGRLPRQKVRISRARVMDSALKVMDLYASQKALLEVEYFGEVGTGLGPTLEFYTLVSRELRRSELRLWLEDGPPTASLGGATAAGDGGAAAEEDAAGAGGYVFSPFGLYPRAVARAAGRAAAGGEQATRGAADAAALHVHEQVRRQGDARQPAGRLLLGHLLPAGVERQLSISDVADLNPQLAATLRKLGARAQARRDPARGRQACRRDERVGGPHA